MILTSLPNSHMRNFYENTLHVERKHLYTLHFITLAKRALELSTLSLRAILFIIFLYR